MNTAEVHERIREIQARGSFNEAEHTYEWDGRKMQSVTRNIERWEVPFDAEAAAAGVARRDGMTVEEVLAMWEANRDSAAQMGSRVHLGIENILLHGPGQEQEWCPESLKRVGLFQDWWRAQGPRLEVVAVELKVYSPRWGLAGTMDLLARNLATGDLHVLDWKTNKRFRVRGEGYDYLYPPFDRLKNNEHHKYSIQIGAYRLILDEWGIPTNGGTLVWLPPRQERAKAFRAVDLTDKLRGAL